VTLLYKERDLMSVMLQLKVRNLTGRKHAVISDIQ